MSSDKEKSKPFFPEGSTMLRFASLGKLSLTDLSSNKRARTSSNRFRREDIETYLNNPEGYEKQLLSISRFLYNKSPQYRRTINYFAKMPTLDYIIEPYGINTDKAKIDSIKNQYHKVADFLDLMNIKHEFLKVLVTAFKEDTFYGYEYTTKDSYFIQKLNPEYCKISSIEDGIYNYAFDFGYFDKFPEKLEMYDLEFTKKYNLYKNKIEPQWQELDSKRTICIKINEDSEYSIPPFAGTFESIFDIEDYKKLRKSNKKIGNYKLLVQKIPMRDGKDATVNDFLIDFDTMMAFHNRTAEALPEEVGITSVPFDTEAIDFSKGVKDDDDVGDAERDYWSGTGVSQLLFNTDKSSSIGLSNSIKTDEEIVFAVLRQIERWINRRLKHEFKTLKFRVNILNTTIFNKDDVFENALKASQFGLPAKMMASASLGISPSSMVNLAFLENEVLELDSKLIPLSSAHTQSGNEEGKPESKDSDLSEEGLRSKDEEKNDLR